MDFMEGDPIDLDLPSATDVTRGLFSGEVETSENFATCYETFNVDDFLIKNNFHFMPLDELLKDLSVLSQDMVHVLIEKVTSKYEDCLRFCEPYLEQDNENVLELQKIKTDINKFLTQLEKLAHGDLNRMKQVITETLEYSQSLDKILQQLQEQSRIPEILTLAKQLSKALHQMCGTDPLEQSFCVDLIDKLHILVVGIGKMLESLSAINSPFVHHLRNEYHGLLQEFQISLKILTDRCLQDPEQHMALSKALVSTLNP